VVTITARSPAPDVASQLVCVQFGSAQLRRIYTVQGRFWGFCPACQGSQNRLRDRHRRYGRDGLAAQRLVSTPLGVVTSSGEFDRLGAALCHRAQQSGAGRIEAHYRSPRPTNDVGT